MIGEFIGGKKTLNQLQNSIKTMVFSRMVIVKVLNALENNLYNKNEMSCNKNDDRLIEHNLSDGRSE